MLSSKSRWGALGCGYRVGWGPWLVPRSCWVTITWGAGPSPGTWGHTRCCPAWARALQRCPGAGADGSSPRRVPHPGADVGEGEDHAGPAGLAVAQEGGRAAVLPLLQAPHHLHPRLRGEAAPHQGEGARGIREGVGGCCCSLAMGRGQRVAQLCSELAGLLVAEGSRDHLALPWCSPRGAGLGACSHTDLFHVVLVGAESQER